jgi:hypothetical protein
MLQLHNYTPYAADRSVLLDPNGNKIWTVVVKGTFQITPGQACALAPEQEPVISSPRYAAQPGASELLRETEFVVEHPGTEITLNGTAYAPRGKPACSVDAGFEVGPIKKYLRVTGDRRWTRRWWRLHIGKPAPFETMPLVWGRAFGGGRALKNGAVEVDERNPLGVGFYATKDDMKNKPLPNVEYADDSVKKPKSKPRPAGFSAVPCHWNPRRGFAGTFDERWKSKRSPLWPSDYHPQFHLAAPLDQVSEDPLRGNEEVVLKNLTPEGVTRFRLPRVHFSFDTFLRSGRRLSQRAQLDRVILEPDRQKLVMVWRTTLNGGADARAVEKTLIDTKRWVR